MLEAEERYTLALEKMLSENRRALRDLIEAVDLFLKPGCYAEGNQEMLETDLEQARRVLSKTENW